MKLSRCRVTCQTWCGCDLFYEINSENSNIVVWQLPNIKKVTNTPNLVKFVESAPNR
jgi:hypothetical protein